jgi:hypothetical protein
MIYLLLFIQIDLKIGIKMGKYIEKMIYLLLLVQMDLNIGIKMGKIHRDGDLPAIINNYYGSKYWYENGEKHRSLRFKYWLKNGIQYDPKKK